MSARTRKSLGILATITGLAVMASVWAGLAPQSFSLFLAGVAIAIGGALFAAAAIRAGNPASDGSQLKLGGLALVSAIIGGLLMAFCSGCVILWLAGDAGSTGFTNSAISVLVFGGFPFTIGLVLWIFARASRKPAGRG